MILCAVALPRCATALSFVMVSDEELFDGAEGAFTARVTRALPAQDGDHETRYLLEAVEVLAGPTLRGETVMHLLGTVNAPTMNAIAPGVPRLGPGAEILVLYRQRQDGALQPYALSLGLFGKAQGGDGAPVYVRDLEGGTALGERGTRAAAFFAERDAAAFESWLRDRGRGAKRAADYLRAPRLPRAATKAAFAAGAKFATFNRRWFEFDSGQTLPIRSSSAPHEYAALQQALAAWTDDPGSRVLLAYGGPTEAIGLQFAGQFSAHVSWDDPTEVLAPPTLAATILFPVIGFGQPEEFDGGLWYPIRYAAVVMQDGMDEFFDDFDGANRAEVLAHEFGHVLGLGHSCEFDDAACAEDPVLAEALMFWDAHGDGRGATLGDDDRAGIARLYPMQSADLVPPGAPANLVATLDGFDLVLAWDAVIDDESGVARYEIAQCTGTGCNVFALHDSTAETSWVERFADTATRYRFQVRAIDAAGNVGAWSAVADPGADTPAPDFTPIASGSALDNLQGEAGDRAYYAIDVEPAQGYLLVAIGGGSGDADLALWRETTPTQLPVLRFDEADCRADAAGNGGVCFRAFPPAGRYFILVHGKGAYEGLSLSANSGNDATPPSVPSGLDGAVDADFNVLLGWDASTDAGSGVAGYLVERCTGAACEDFASLGESAVESYLDDSTDPTFTYRYRVSARDRSGNTSAASAPFELTLPAPTLLPLENGEPVAGLSGGVDSRRYFTLNVPADQAYLRVTLEGFSGDPALLVAHEQLPAPGAPHYCATLGNLRNCYFADPAAGEYIVLILGLAPYADASLTASYGDAALPILDASLAANGYDIQLDWTAAQDTPLPADYHEVWRCAGDVPDCAAEEQFDYLDVVYGLILHDGLTDSGTRYWYRVRGIDAVGNFGAFSNAADATTDTPTPELLQSGVASTGLSGDVGSRHYFSIEMEEGQDLLEIALQGDEGSVELFHRAGDLPQLGSGDYAECHAGCSIPVAQAGSHFLLLRGSSAFSGHSLTATAGIDAEPPPAPSGLVASLVDDFAVLLEWEFDFIVPDFDHFLIEACTGAACMDFVAFGSTPGSTELLQLDPATDYRFRIRAVDVAGNIGAASNVAAASTADVAVATLDNDQALPGLPLQSAAGFARRYFRLDLPADSDFVRFRLQGSESDVLILWIASDTLPSVLSEPCALVFFDSEPVECSLSPAPAGSYYALVAGYDDGYDGYSLTGTYVNVAFDDLDTTYDGQPHGVGVVTDPPGLDVAVTYDGSAALPVNAGSYAVIASVATEGYSGSASGTLTIAQASQSIDFAPLPDRDLAAGPFTLSASGGGSNQPVVFASLSPDVCVTGGTHGAEVELHAAGECAIRATQAGDANHLAAAPVDRGFQVTQANTPPSISDLAPQSLLEDATLGPLSLVLDDAETDPADLQLEVESSNPALIGPAGLVLAGSGAHRTLSLTPVADANGSATITLTVADAQGASASTAFALSVIAVNDAPRLSLLDPPLHADGSAGPQSVPGFASAIGGPPDEEGQVVSYSLQKLADPAGIVGTASLDADGTLAYTLSGSSGVARFRVTATDDGGRANGGVDRASAEFRILVGEGVSLELQVSRVAPDAKRLASALAKGLDQAQYRIELSNYGTQPVVDATLTVVASQALAQRDWECDAPLPCDPDSGEDDVFTHIALDAGQSAVVWLIGTLVAGQDWLELSAQVVPPAGVAVLSTGRERVLFIEPVSERAVYRSGFE